VLCLIWIAGSVSILGAWVALGDVSARQQGYQTAFLMRFFEDFHLYNKAIKGGLNMCVIKSANATVPVFQFQSCFLDGCWLEWSLKKS